ncbi:excinuclease ABC subunit UvrC [Candidatus Sumerlaeota bacterium]|nr:excinuclease ABC subunit UvrC [Candidatus Sumerlaeota bacterium]
MTRLALDDLSQYPTQPGVYLMLDRTERPLYVGKAKNLRARLRQYFTGQDERVKISFLLRKVCSIQTIVTVNEKEALLLENELIKKHQPHFNVNLRDDKNFLLIRIDPKSDWPKIEFTRKRLNDGALYFGPFSSARAVRQTIRNLQKLFPLRNCKDGDFYNRARPCILHDVGKCCAPCVGQATREEYAELVQQVRLFLLGRRDELTRRMKQEIETHSARLEFERAMELRDRLRMVANMQEKQTVVTDPSTHQDVVAIATGEGRHAVAVHHYRNGFLGESRRYDFKDVGQELEMLMSEFLMQFYGGEREIPREILLSHPAASSAALEEILTQKREGPVHLRAPERGRMREMVRLALANAEDQIHKLTVAERDAEATLSELQTALKLPELPSVIECLDISNIQGTLSVGSLVRFKNAEPDKAGYRRFKIQSVEGSNDFAMMKEVIQRRYGRLQREGEDMPGLVIVDGGKGQLNSALEALHELGVSGIPFAGLAKSRLKDMPNALRKRMERSKYRTEERLFLPNRKNPVILPHGSPALYLVQRIRDEAHRFAITYHKKLRSQANLRSILDEIPGVGPKRRRALLNHFGSLARIKTASEEELTQAEGINPALARQIHTFLHHE